MTSMRRLWLGLLATSFVLVSGCDDPDVVAPVRPVPATSVLPTTTSPPPVTSTTSTVIEVASPENVPDVTVIVPRAPLPNGPQVAEAALRPQVPNPAPTGAAEPAFANCAAVRAAGRAPIRRGEPGFESKFDRDNDGVGCEVTGSSPVPAPPTLTTASPPPPTSRTAPVTQTSPPSSSRAPATTTSAPAPAPVATTVPVPEASPTLGPELSPGCRARGDCSGSRPNPEDNPNSTDVETGEPSWGNCTAVRAAGKAPIHRGDPGFQDKFDADGDGVGCE